MAGSKSQSDTRAEAPDWNAVRRAYEAADEPVAALCRRFGITPGRLYRRATKEQWHARRGTRAVTAATAAPSPSSSPVTDEMEAAGAIAVPERLPPVGPEERKQLIERLYRACERQIAEAESRFAATDGAPAREADAKHLGALVQTLSKLNDLDQANREERTSGNDSEADIDELRTKLARRLDRLRKAGRG